jgi:hypothetical protein
MGTTFDEVRIWRDPACPACGEGVAAAASDIQQPATAGIG